MVIFIGTLKEISLHYGKYFFYSFLKMHGALHNIVCNDPIFFFLGHIFNIVGRYFSSVSCFKNFFEQIIPVEFCRGQSQEDRWTSILPQFCHQIFFCLFKVHNRAPHIFVYLIPSIVSANI